MALSRLTKITGPGVSTDTNWVGNNANFTGITTTATSFNIGVTTIHSTLIESHNIVSTGVITATGGSFSGNVTAVDGTFSGNVSIAGTLTYEDVTNIDAVGIITAPALDVDDFLDVGSNIKLGNAGVITATTFKGDGDFVDIDVDGHTNLDNVSIAGISTFSGILDATNTPASIRVAQDIQHKGDADTKITFPANDTISFDTAGNERLRIDAGGGVQVGTSTATASKVTVYGANDAAAIFQGSSTGTGAANGFLVGNNGGTDGLLWNYENGNTKIATNNVERLRITSGGQVVIGDDDTDKANGHFDDLIVGANASTTETHGITIVCGNAATNGGIAFSDGSNGGADAYRGMISYQHNDNHMQFRTNAVERLRIHNDGDVTITATGDPHLKVTGPGQAQLTLTSTSGTDHCSINFGDSDDHDAGEIRYTNSSNSLNFDTNGTHRLTIDSSGHVLPASDSAYYLGSASVRWAQVNTDYLSAGISNTNGGVASFKGSNYNQVNITHSGNSGWGLLLTNSDSTSNGGYHESTSGNNNSCAIVNVNNDALYLGTNNNARWRVEHDGHFIPTGSGSYDMGSTGKRVRTFYAVNSLNTSDRNLKNTITESDLGLDFICKLKPVSYKWNQNEGESLDTKTHYGLISQDVEEVIIETGKTLDDFGAVDKPEKGAMGLSYNEFISPLIKAIQEQQEQIKKLQEKISALEGS